MKKGGGGTENVFCSQLVRKVGEKMKLSCSVLPTASQAGVFLSLLGQKEMCEQLGNLDFKIFKRPVNTKLTWNRALQV